MPLSDRFTHLDIAPNPAPLPVTRTNNWTDTRPGRLEGTPRFTPNTYRIHDDVAYVALTNRSGEIAETSVSDSTLEHVLTGGRWFRTSNGRYVARVVRTPGGKKTQEYLHRFLTDAPAGMHVDHIDGNTLNNQLSNLEVVPPAVNIQRRQGANVNSTTGVRGVYWDTTAGKYRVSLETGGSTWFVGHYESLETATAVSIEARRMLMPRARFTDAENTVDEFAELSALEVAWIVANRLTESALRRGIELPHTRRVNAALLTQRVDMLGGRFYRDARGDWRLAGSKMVLDPLMDELHRQRPAIIELLDSCNGEW